MIRLICGTTPDAMIIALKNLGVARKTGDTFLNARTAGIVNANHWRAILHRHIHDLADLLGVRFGQRSTKNRKVLTKDIDHAAVHGAPAGDHAVACRFAFGHAEIGRAMRHKHIEFFKRAFVEQKLHPLARGQLAFRVLCLDTALSPARAGRNAASFKFGKYIGHGSPPHISTTELSFRARFRKQNLANLQT